MYVCLQIVQCGITLVKRRDLQTARAKKFLFPHFNSLFVHMMYTSNMAA